MIIYITINKSVKPIFFGLDFVVPCRTIKFISKPKKAKYKDFNSLAPKNITFLIPYSLTILLTFEIILNPKLLLKEIVSNLKKQGKTIVLTNGCFDIIHKAHVKILKEMSKLGDVFIVALNSDKSVKRFKGDSRPINSESDRAYVIGNIKGVDKVNDETLTSPEPVEETEFYTVKKGDYLSKIAKSYYGNAMKYKEIFEANREVIKDPDLTYPGQVLRIPKV